MKRKTYKFFGTHIPMHYYGKVGEEYLIEVQKDLNRDIARAEKEGYYPEQVLNLDNMVGYTILCSKTVVKGKK